MRSIPLAYVVLLAAACGSNTPTTPAPAPAPVSLAQHIPTSFDALAFVTAAGPLTVRPSGAFEGRVVNAASLLCASRIRGVLSLVGASGDTVDSAAWTLPASLVLAPGQSVPIQGCCFTATSQAVAFSIAPRFDSHACH